MPFPFEFRDPSLQMARSLGQVVSEEHDEDNGVSTLRAMFEGKQHPFGFVFEGAKCLVQINCARNPGCKPGRGCFLSFFWPEKWRVELLLKRNAALVFLNPD